MTEQQQKVFASVCSLLEEHFDCSVVSVAYSRQSDGQGYSKHSYAGGRIQAIGLVRVVEQEMVHEQINTQEVEE